MKKIIIIFFVFLGCYNTAYSYPISKKTAIDLTEKYLIDNYNEQYKEITSRYTLEYNTKIMSYGKKYQVYYFIEVNFNRLWYRAFVINVYSGDIFENISYYKTFYAATKAIRTN